MRVSGRLLSRAGALCTVVTVLAVVAVGACSSSGESSDTLDPLVGTPGDTGGTVATTAGPATTGPATVDPAQAGSGFVSLHVSVANEGIDETLSLDRASVEADALDPLSLDARCTALDGGDTLAVSVIDLRRLEAGSQLVSAVVRTEDAVNGSGEYDGTIEIADTQQQTISFDATVVVDEGARSGSFEGEDDSGNVVTGTFVCADQPIAAPPTTIVVDVGEEVPGSSLP